VRRLIAGQLAAQYLILSAQLGKELELMEQQAQSEEDTGKAKKLADQIKGLRERAAQLRNLRRIDRILEFAGSFLGIVGNEWDKRNGLLACPNGVINLRTGVLSPGDPSDYIRSACPTEWKGLDAPAPRFIKFLQEVFNEVNSSALEITKYVQELLGYGITGSTQDHVMPIFYGPRGRNGKDTLLEALASVLGRDIAMACSTDVFIAQERKNSAGGASEHLYELMGKRLAWAAESEDGPDLMRIRSS
jgi:putative DNA primase/helicase